MKPARMVRVTVDQLTAYTTEGSRARYHVDAALTPELLLQAERSTTKQVFVHCIRAAFMAGVVTTSEKVSEKIAESVRVEEAKTAEGNGK